MPQSVYAKVAFGFRRNISVEDEVTAVVDYGGGATGVLVAATHDLVGTDRFEILGDYYASEVLESESRWGTQHVAVLENFAANILDGTPLIAPGSEGINEVRLANATYLSSWTRCRGPAGLRR
jgi:predicted dehydrogenase